MARTKNFDEEQVLDKAVDIFRRRGYLATTPADLVAFLGISRSSLYDTYGDKRSLFIKTLQRYRDTSTNDLKAIAESTDDVLQTIKTIFNRTVNGCFEDQMPKGCFLVNSVVELPHNEVELIAMVDESREAHRKVFVSLIQKGQANGQVTSKMEASALADYMVNCLNGISISSKGGMNRQLCEDVVKNSLSIFCV